MDKNDKHKRQEDLFHPHDIWPPPKKEQKKKDEKEEEEKLDTDPIDPTDMMVYDIEPQKDKEKSEDRDYENSDEN